MLPNGIAENQLHEVKRAKAPTVAPQPGPPINESPIVISDALAKFIGTDGTFPQDDALKYLWDYIKANQLEVWLGAAIFFFRITIPPLLAFDAACIEFLDLKCTFAVRFNSGGTLSTCSVDHSILRNKFTINVQKQYDSKK